MDLQSTLARIELETALSVSICADRLREAVMRRPRIEDRRHWGTVRCLTGEISGALVSLNVEYRYVGPLYGRYSWKTGFRGRLVERREGAALVGDFGFRYMTGTGPTWLIRPFGMVVIILALALGTEGLVGGQLDYLAGSLLVLPGLGLVVVTPWLQRSILRGAADDERLLRSFVAELLQARNPRTPPLRPRRGRRETVRAHA